MALEVNTTKDKKGEALHAIMTPSIGLFSVGSVKKEMCGQLHDLA
jgi:hypothetical protein